MATFAVSRGFPNILHRTTRIRNGVIPDYRVGKGMADAINFTTQYQRKLVFSACHDLQSMPTPDQTGGDTWHFQFHAGHASESQESLELLVEVLLRPNDSYSDPDPDTNPSFWYLDIGATQTSNYLQSKVADSNRYFDDFMFQSARIDISANTQYQCFFHHEEEVNLVAVRVFELHARQMTTSDAITIDPRSYAADNAITDAQHKELCAENLHDLFERNSAHIFNVTTNDQYVPAAGAYTTTSTSFVNMFDGTAGGSVTVNTVGFIVPTLYWGPLHSATNTVKCRVAVFGSISVNGGNNAEFRLQNAGGTLVTIGSWGTTDAWKTGDFLLDDVSGGEKIDLEFRITVAGTFRVLAVSCYLYEV